MVEPELPFANMWVPVCARCGDTGYDNEKGYGGWCRDCEGNPEWNGPKAIRGVLIKGTEDAAIERIKEHADYLGLGPILLGRWVTFDECAELFGAAIGET